TGSLLAILLLAAPLLPAQKAAKRPATVSATAEKTKTATSLDVPPETIPQAKVVQYGDQDIIKIRTKLRHTTLIVLPKTERILDFICGDKEFWIVDGTENVAYVKPAKAGAETNLNLVTATGNIYSFILSEVSDRGEESPDLKVSVELKDSS